MSLNVDISRIANHDTVCYEGEGENRAWKQATTDLGFYTMSIDIGEITADNAVEFYSRCCLLCDLYGGFSLDRVPSIETIRAHIGLRTNVATISRAKWLAKVRKIIDARLNDYKYRVQESDRAAARVAAANA